MKGAPDIYIYIDSSMLQFQRHSSLNVIIPHAQQIPPLNEVGGG